MNALELAKQAAVIANEKKASRISVMDLRTASDICEYQVICSGENERQTKAIAQAIEEYCVKQEGLRPLAIEGKQSGHWILLDYGPTIIHVFLNSIRDYYAIEEIWPTAKRL